MQRLRDYAPRTLNTHLARALSWEGMTIAECFVVMTNPTAAATFKKILVPIDFEAPSKHALALAIDLAVQYGGTIVLMHTWEIPAYAYGGMGITLSPVDVLTPIQRVAQSTLDETLKQTQEKLPTATAILEEGTPWQRILDVIERTKPDLVVMGTHGRRNILRMLLGSVAEKIVRVSPVPVLTVREPPSTK